MPAVEHFDVIVVGAGLSGIGAAYHLQTACPNKSFVVLEAREATGGTWDLFRYPGVRSDSDMFTLGYRFKPWLEHDAIAGGSTILRYLRDTARDHGIDAKIRLAHRVMRISWSSVDARWTLDIERGSAREPLQLSCGFLHMCPGYYAYDAGYTPTFAGADRFAGRIVHPQSWTEDIDYVGKRVVVIGSGATAITLVPELAKQAEHVTMLQRSPTYIVSMPAHDPLSAELRERLPANAAYGLTRWKNIVLSMLMYAYTRAVPGHAKGALIRRVGEALGPEFDVARHFTPNYDVWDQRLCLVPDGDFFEAIRGGRVDIVTDHIDTFTERGIKLRSGVELEADLVVTATGLSLLFLGGLDVTVDGSPVKVSDTLNYKGCMFTGVPNLAYTFGYTHASWTLKADLVAEYVCRLLKHMDAVGATDCTPRRNDPTVQARPWLSFTSGYITRALEQFPSQGSKYPFRLNQNYLLDLLTLRHRTLDDGMLEFGSARARATRA